jgi:beta-glucosidase
LLSSDSLEDKYIYNSINNIIQTKIISGFTNFYPKNNESNINSKNHQTLALKAAQKSIILLKNENSILPLSKAINNIGIIGPSAAIARLDGYGSSMVTPPYSVSPLEGIQKKINPSNIYYSKGCDIYSNDTSYFQEAREIAKKVNTIIFVGGLDETMEGEGFGIGGDRKNNTVELPSNQQNLINEIAKVNPNIIIILKSGGVCAISQCIQNIKGLIYAFYPGMEGGNALADVLFGDINPSGKMPVTMPKNNIQMPVWNDDFNDDYNCGYFYYDQLNLKPEFAFGFGLSYTSFKISNLKTNKLEYSLGEEVKIEVDVTNIGQRSGEEVIQLYCSNKNKKNWAPIKELRGFEKVSLKPNETKTISFILRNEELYSYDEEKEVYNIIPGTYEIAVGNSSDSLPLKTNIKIINSKLLPELKVLHLYNVPRYPIPGEKIQFLAVIKNTGSIETPINTPINMVLKIDNKEIINFKNEISSIPTGGMKLVELINTDENSNFFEPMFKGEYNLELVLNDLILFNESDNSNNTFISKMKVYDLDSVTKFGPLYQKQEAFIYPNPAFNILNIYNPKFEQTQISIINIFGQSILIENYFTKEIKLNIENLKAGVYSIRINTPSNQTIKQFIKL